MALWCIMWHHGRIGTTQQPSISLLTDITFEPVAPEIVPFYLDYIFRVKVKMCAMYWMKYIQNSFHLRRDAVIYRGGAGGGGRFKNVQM